MLHDEYLVTINVPPSLEELVVDCLLTFEYQEGFTTFHVNAHDHINEGLSLAEQVSGRQGKIRFNIHVPVVQLDAFIDTLKQEFSGTGIHYWVSPIVAEGVI
jgi:predicted secreted hydrolase